MAKFVYLYSGTAMAETPEAQEQSMQEWTAWFGGLGGAVTDIGNPFGASATVGAGGTSGGASSIGGYSVIEANSLDDATAKASGCPALKSGGKVEVYEALAM
jgi:hypothetical protein